MNTIPWDQMFQNLYCMYIFMLFCRFRHSKFAATEADDKDAIIEAVVRAYLKLNMAERLVPLIKDKV